MFSFCYECSIIIFFQVSSLDFKLSIAMSGGNPSSLSSLVTKSIKVIISTLENDLLSWINGIIILAMVRKKSNLVTPVFLNQYFIYSCNGIQR